MKKEQRAKMYQYIKRHGEQLNVIFKTGIEPIELCKKLRKLELQANKLSTDCCNGDIDLDRWDLKSNLILAKVNLLLSNPNGYVPIFVNGDARGYALKIDDQFVRNNNVKLHRDWGGYGIIAPDFTPELTEQQKVKESGRH